MIGKKGRIAVIIIICLTFLSLIPLRSLKFDFNIEKLFPAHDPELAFFRDFQSRFRSDIDDEFIFIGLKNNAGIFQKAFLKNTDSLTRFITALDGIIKSYSLTSAHSLFFDNEEINARPLIHIHQPELYADDSVYVFQSKEYRDLLISRDGKSIAIAAFNRQFLTDEEKDRILNRIKGKIQELGFDESHITAKIRVERVYVQEIGKNLRKYLLLSLTLICIALYILFRSLRAMVLPLLLIGAAILWTLSLISLTGHTLDIISSLLPPILAAICMSDIIHISTHYIEQLRSGLPKKEALRKAYKEVGLATFFTCCTVAAGFITLGITDIIPIRNFGFFAAAGIFLSFGLTLVVLYVYYSYAPVPAIAYEKRLDSGWKKFMGFCFKKIIGNKGLVFLSLFLLIAVSAFYASKIEINSSLLQEIPRRNPILDDYRFMEKDFAGTRPFELALTLNQQTGTFYDLKILRQAEEAERFLKEQCGIGYIISPLSLYRGANKAFHKGDNDRFHLPATQQEINRYTESIMQTEFADEMSHYILPDGSGFRISGRLPNLSVKEFEPLKRKIDSFFQSKKNQFPFSHHITGSAILLDKATWSLTENLFTGIIFDIIIISLIALFLLGSWRAAIIALLPNVLPLIFMAGVMGFMGIYLKADTSVIFAIALGLAVDDTIHFMGRLRIELGKGLSLAYAVKRTYLSTGKAIIITTLVLLSGFMTLLSSSFGGTFYIGLLISLCLFCAMILELTLTPLLILLFYKPGKFFKRQKATG